MTSLHGLDTVGVRHALRREQDAPCAESVLLVFDAQAKLPFQDM